MQVLQSVRQEAPKVPNVTRVASVNCPSMEILLRLIWSPALGLVEGDTTHFARLNCVLELHNNSVGGGPFEKGERGECAGRYLGRGVTTKARSRPGRHEKPAKPTECEAPRKWPSICLASPVPPIRQRKWSLAGRMLQPTRE